MASGDINEALTAMGLFAQSLRRSTKQYSHFIDELARNTEEERGDLREKSKSIEATKRTTEKLEKLRDAASDLQGEYKSGRKTNKAVAKEMKEMAKRINKIAPGTYTDDMIDSFRDVRRGTGDVDREFSNLTAAIREQTQQTHDTHDVQHEELQQLYNHNYALRDSTAAITQNIKSFFNFEAGMFKVIRTTQGITDRLVTAQEKQLSSYDSLADGVDSVAYSMSLTPQEVLKFAGNMKIASLSVTDEYANQQEAMMKMTSMLSKNVDGQKSLNDKAYELTGTYDGAASLLTTTIGVLKTTGDKLSLEETGTEANKLMSSFKVLGRLSNKSTQELGTMVEGMMNSAEIKSKLERMSNMDERRRFRDNLLNDMKRNKELGMSIEETFALAKSGAKLEERSVLDKRIQGIQLKQFATMLGVEGADDIDRLSKSKDENDIKAFHTIMGEVQGAIKDLEESAQNEFSETGVEGVQNNKLLGVQQLGKALNIQEVFGEHLKNSYVDLQASKSTTGEGAEDIVLSTTEKIIRYGKETWDEYFRPLIADPVFGLLSGAGQILGSILMTAGTLYTTAKLVSVAGGGLSSVLGGAKTGLGKFVGLLGEGATKFRTLLGTISGASGTLIRGITTGFSSLVPTILAGIGSFGATLVAAIPMVLATGVGLAIGDAVGPYMQEGWKKVDNLIGTNSWGSVVDGVGWMAEQVGLGVDVSKEAKEATLEMSKHVSDLKNDKHLSNSTQQGNETDILKFLTGTMAEQVGLGVDVSKEAKEAKEATLEMSKHVSDLNSDKQHSNSTQQGNETDMLKLLTGTMAKDFSQAPTTTQQGNETDMLKFLTGTMAEQVGLGVNASKEAKEAKEATLEMSKQVSDLKNDKQRSNSTQQGNEIDMLKFLTGTMAKDFSQASNGPTTTQIPTTPVKINQRMVDGTDKVSHSRQKTESNSIKELQQIAATLMEQNELLTASLLVYNATRDGITKVGNTLTETKQEQSLALEKQNDILNEGASFGILNAM